MNFLSIIKCSPHLSHSVLLQTIKISIESKFVVNLAVIFYLSHDDILLSNYFISTFQIIWYSIIESGNYAINMLKNYCLLNLNLHDHLDTRSKLIIMTLLLCLFFCFLFLDKRLQWVNCDDEKATYPFVTSPQRGIAWCRLIWHELNFLSLTK